MLRARSIECRGDGEEASGGLGHGAVATYPDRPYLVWSFDYVNGGGTLGSANPWYDEPVIPLVWDANWFGTAGAWVVMMLTWSSAYAQ